MPLRGRRVALSLCVALGVATLAVGCGSSGQGGSATSTNGGGSGSASSSVSAARRAVKAAMAPTTTIGQTTPLKTKPPAGKTLVWLNCDFLQCTLTGKAIATAAQALGWNFKEVSYTASDPATLVSAFKQALQYKPVGVILSGAPYATWASIAPLYEKAKVPVVEGLAGGAATATNSVLRGNIWNSDDVDKDAKILANWMAADSGGKGNAVVLGVPNLPILGGFPAAFTAALKRVCPGCSAKTINATVAQVGSPATANGLLISAAQRNPSVGYIISADGALNVGIPAALAGAGLSKIKYAAALGQLENQSQIMAGRESAVTGGSIGYYGWQMTDAVLRAMEKMSVPPGDGGQPHQLLTKANIGTPTQDLRSPQYKALFKKLWHIG